MTCLRFSRFRLAVIIGAALPLAAAGLAFAQKESPDSATGAKGCTWSGWYQPSPGGAIKREAPRTLKPGESIKVEFSAGCAGVGTGGASASQPSMIMFGKDGGPGLQKLEGDGFTIERTGERAFTLKIGSNAAPGSRTLSAVSFVGEKLLLVPMEFKIAGSAVAIKGAGAIETPAGFCCQDSGSECVALRAGDTDDLSRCGNGNVWVPVAKQGGLEVPKMLCDYACKAPSPCLQKNGDCVVASPDECREVGGELFLGSIEYCRNYAATASMPDKFYFSPSTVGSQTVNKGSQKPGKPDGAGGTCMQIRPLDDGTYPPPAPPAYDTYTKSAADCADASKYYCVTMPVGGALQRGCTSMPIQIPEGTGQPCKDYDATRNPEDPLTVHIDGATRLYPPYCRPQSGVGGNAAYSRYKPKPGSGAGPDGGFSTAAECRLACPPCKNKDCSDAGKPGTEPKPVCGNGICEKNEAGTCSKDCPQEPEEPQCRRPGYACMSAREQCEEGFRKVIDDTDPACRGGDPKHPIMDANCAKCELGGANPSLIGSAVCKVQPAQPGACGDPFKADGLGMCLGATNILVRQCGGDNDGRYQTFRCPDGCSGGACKREQVKVCSGDGSAKFFCSMIIDTNGQCVENDLTCEGGEKKVCSRSDDPAKQRSCGTKSCEGTCCRCVPYENASKCGDGQCTEEEKEIICTSCAAGTPPEKCRCRKVCESDCGAYDNSQPQTIR